VLALEVTASAQEVDVTMTTTKTTRIAMPNQLAYRSILVNAVPAK